VKPLSCSIIILLCLALPGCSVSTYGLQSTAGGATATTTSTQVAATAKFSGGVAAFSSGQAISPAAPGGHAFFTGGSAVFVPVVIIFAEALGAVFGARSQPAPRTDAIAHTCSCYQKQVMGDE
jgi:hypothetical protein